MSVYDGSGACVNVSTEAPIVAGDHTGLIESEDSHKIHFLFEKIADNLKINIHISLIEILQYAENEYSLILCASIDTTSNPNYDYDITENAKISNWLCSHKCRMVQLRE